ncbi:MAG: YbaY family lipoprotein [Gammaproteobacteria bacterium]
MRLKPIPVYLALICLTGCSSFSDSGHPRITGKISYKEPFFLTPDAKVDIKLLDVSLQDVKATVIAETTLQNPGQTPISFSLEYDSSLIRENMSYSVSAQITDRGRRLFISDTHNGVITRGNSNKVDISLVALQSNPVKRPDAPLANTYWKVIAVNNQAIKTNEGQREAHIKFRQAESTTSGQSGCNSFSGSYESSGNKISFGNLAVTMMACMQGMDTEQAFLKALAETDNYRVLGDTMLFSKEDRVLIHFEAIYF